MTSLKKTRITLFSSIVSFILCIVMLTSTTFAWFTTSVSSNNNVIQSGELKVGMYWTDGDTDADNHIWVDASVGSIFGNISWEPGVLNTRKIKITNEGSLAFKYEVVMMAKNKPSVLADVIDVYIVSDVATYSAVGDMTYVGSLAEVFAGPITLDSGSLFPSDTSEDSERILTIALMMREGLGMEYQNMPLGSEFSVKLLATQLSYENGSDGGNDSETEKIVKRRFHALPNVLTDLPASALATSPGVTFATSPYAYTDKTLFSGGHVVRLGIPVKTVKAVDENQTFTLSVVKTANGTASATGDTYIYVSQHRLTLPIDQLHSTTVNDWIYVDVDITLGEDETLAFGMPDDSVEWGYIGTKKSEYLFRSCNTNWSTVNGSSILFDVIMEEELVFKPTEHGLASITTGSALPKATTDLPESAIGSSSSVVFPTAPYSYLNTELFSGKSISSIGIPVKSVAALDENQTFTLTVVKKNTHPYQVVSEHVLTLPLDQLGDSLNVNKWVYIDLDLTLADDETLAFGGKNDSVVWGWKSGGSSDYKFRDVNNNTATGIYFDVTYTDIYTYDEYLRELADEEARLEAEKAKKEREEALAALLSGKNISILGDSISTFKGYSNNTSYNSTIGGNAVYYSGTNYINTVNETWWMQAINRLDMELVVNNSWSGDTVTGRGIARSLQLHNNDGTKPDIIAVYLGVNDFRTKVTAETFASAYEQMIKGMKEKYSDAEIYLFTLVYTTNVNSGVKPDDIVYFNEAIVSVADNYGCTLVDLYNDSGITKENMPSYMGDGNLHPNYAGMDLITDAFIEALAEKYLPSGDESTGNEGDDTAIEINLPDYWKDYLDGKIAEINGRTQALGDDSDAFIFITDQHLDGTNEYSDEIINYISAKTSVNKVVFGGDILKGSSSDDIMLKEYADSFSEDILLLGMRGNHDDDGNLTAKMFYDIMVQPLSGRADISDELYYCYDNESQKIRYIITDSVASGSTNLTSNEQISWMKSKILELDEDWTVVIFHHGIWEGSTTKKTLEYSIDGKLIIDAVDSVYDSARCTVAAIYSGHNHRDYFGYSDKGYALISTTVNSEDAALSKYDIINPSRPEGTVKEESFDVILVDPSTNRLEIIRIGAGDDREISYASNLPRDVENVSLNRFFATAVAGGNPIDLTAILTPAKVTDDRVIWTIESGDELGSITADGLKCRFTPGDLTGTVVVQVKTVQGDHVASCRITIVDGPASVDITSDFGWTPGSITHADGVASSQYEKDWLYSNLVDVSLYDSITFTHVQTTNSTTPLGYAFYDESGKYISGASNGGVSYDTVVKTVAIPEGAKYFRVMWMNTTHSRYDAEKYEITTHFFCYGNIGDSEPDIAIPTRGVSLNKSSATLIIGDAPSVSLTAAILPADATSKDVVWSIISGGELGSIASDGLNCIFTSSGEAGTVVIRVMTVNGEYTAECSIKIVNPGSSVDITDSFLWTPGSITHADGVASSNYSKDWLYSNMVDVGGFDSITFTHVQTTNSTTPLGYAFYDESGKYISGASNGGVSYDTVVKTVAIPEGAKYFRVMWMNTTHSRYDAEKYEITTHFFCYLG